MKLQKNIKLLEDNINSDTAKMLANKNSKNYDQENSVSIDKMTESNESKTNNSFINNQEFMRLKNN